MAVDTSRLGAFNGDVAESWVFGNRTFIEDARDDGSYMRVTWHPDRQQFVISHWDNDVCAAATRVPASAAPNLIGLLSKGLGEALHAPMGKQPASLRKRMRQYATRVRRLLKVESDERLPLRELWRRSA